MSATTALLLCVAVAIAVFGAWESARHRHELNGGHKRRSTDK